MFTNPTVAEFKDFFARDFPFGSDIETTVIDADIDKAILKADCTLNVSLFSKQEKYTLAFLLLTAHFLTTSLRTSSQGTSGSFQFLQNSRSVGSVSESLNIPSKISENPLFSSYMNTSYGGEYLMLIWPYLRGQVFIVKGGTTA